MVRSEEMPSRRRPAARGTVAIRRAEETPMQQSDVVIPKGMEAAYDRFHYAPAVKVGDRLYCSGVIGVGPDRKPPADAEAQFALAFDRVKSILEAAGASF